MTDRDCKTQAALLYRSAPHPDLAAVARAIDANLDVRTDLKLTVAPDATNEFLLLTNRAYHIVIAVHPAALPPQALERALTSPVAGADNAKLQSTVQDHTHHILVIVGDGPMPINFDAPEKFDIHTKLELLNIAVRHLAQTARPDAVHFSPADMMVSADQVENASPDPQPVEQLVHPVLTPKMHTAGGVAGLGLRFENSDILLGKTLEIEGIPVPVPLDIAQSLGHTLIRQNLRGGLPLADGDTVNQSGGMALYVRHIPADHIAPNGRIVASFWAPETSANATADAQQTPYTPHPGYLALSQTAAEPKTANSDEWRPESDVSTLSSAGKTATNNSRWMIFGAVALLLWVVIPFLGLPRLALEAAFSDELLTSDSDSTENQN